MGHSADQLRAAELTAKCTGAMSILGSCSILYDIIFRKGKAGKQMTMLSILLGMSIFDIGASSMYIVGSWAIPSDEGGNVFQPSGTDQTCVAQGFLFQLFASAIPMYNLSLAMYSFLAVNRQWSEDRFQTYQWCFHVLPVAFGSITATYGVVHDQFNPNELWCWFSDTEHSDMLKFVLYYGPLWLVFWCIVILFVLIYRHVRMIEKLIYQEDHKKMMQVRQSRQGGFEEKQEQAPTASSSYNNSSEQQQRKKKLRLSRAVFIQGVQFSCVFILTFLFPTITRSQQLHKKSVKFGVLFMMTLFLPLQGFLNSLVYFKAEIKQLWKRCQNKLLQSVSVIYIVESPQAEDHTGIFADNEDDNNEAVDGVSPVVAPLGAHIEQDEPIDDEAPTNESFRTSSTSTTPPPHNASAAPLSSTTNPVVVQDEGASNMTMATATRTPTAALALAASRTVQDQGEDNGTIRSTSDGTPASLAYPSQDHEDSEGPVVFEDEAIVSEDELLDPNQSQEPEVTQMMDDNGAMKSDVELEEAKDTMAPVENGVYGTDASP